MLIKAGSAPGFDPATLERPADSGRTALAGSEKRPDEDLRTRAVVETLARNTEFSGVVSVVSRAGGREALLFEAAFGSRCPEHGGPNSVDLRFNVASVGKMFTAIAVHQLAERCRLGLGDPVEKFLPGIFDPIIGSATVQELLTHRSGLGSVDATALVRACPRSCDDYVALVRDNEHPADVDAARNAIAVSGRSSVGNSGHYLLGAIIESASGVEYFAYLRKEVFEPSGLTRRTGPESTFPVPGAAAGFVRAEEGSDGGYRLPNGLELSMYRASPAGGMYSTVADLQRFASAIYDRSLLGPASTESLFGCGGVEGIGFRSTVVGRNRHMTGQTGSWRGISTAVMLFPESESSLVVLGNRDDRKHLFADGVTSYFLDRGLI